MYRSVEQKIVSPHSKHRNNFKSDFLGDRTIVSSTTSQKSPRKPRCAGGHPLMHSANLRGGKNVECSYDSHVESENDVVRPMSESHDNKSCLGDESTTHHLNQGTNGDNESTSHDPLMCRICLEEGGRVDFIAPCACKGTSKWVHRSCLDKWRSIKEDTAFSKCTECHFVYEIDHPTTDDGCERKCRFYSLVVRDLSLALALLLLILATISFVVYLSDSFNHRSLLHFLRMERESWLCYALAGTAIFCAYLGFHFVCIYMRICTSSQPLPAADGCCQDTCFVPYYITPDLQPSCCCVECGNVECCGSSGSSLSEGTSSGCACCECSGAEMGHELLVVALCFFAVLAVFGLVMSIFLGVLILQSIVAKHVHVLDKWTLTKNFVVRDLAAPSSSQASQLFPIEIEPSPNHSDLSPTFSQTLLFTASRWTRFFSHSTTRSARSDRTGLDANESSRLLSVV